MIISDEPVFLTEDPQVPNDDPKEFVHGSFGMDFLFSDTLKKKKKKYHNYRQILTICLTSTLLGSCTLFFCSIVIFGPWAFSNWPIEAALTFFGFWILTFLSGLILMAIFYKEEDHFSKLYYRRTDQTIIQEKHFHYGSVFKGVLDGVKTVKTYAVAASLPKVVRVTIEDSVAACKQTRFTFTGIDSKPSIELPQPSEDKNGRPKILNRNISHFLAREFGGFHFFDEYKQMTWFPLKSPRSFDKSYYQSGWWDEIVVYSKKIEHQQDPFVVLNSDLVIVIIGWITGYVNEKPSENWKDNLSEIGRMSLVSRKWRESCHQAGVWQRVWKLFKPMMPFTQLPPSQILRSIGYFDTEEKIVSMHYIYNTPPLNSLK